LSRLSQAYVNALSGLPDLQVQCIDLAHLITTMDAPGWVYRFIYKSPGISALKYAVSKFLRIFCGPHHAA
jgi:hypothetical protein